MRRRVFGLGMCLAAALVCACGGGGDGPAAATDGTWRGPVLTETDETAGATNVRLAVGPNGHAVVSWSCFHGASLADVFVCRYDPASGWGPTVAPQRDIFRITYPAMDLLVDSAGNALGLWGERQILPAGEPSTYYATTFDVSTGVWSAPVAMESDMTGKAQQAAVAQGPAGSFWVLFGLYQGATVEIYVNHFTLAGGWSGPVLLDTADWDPADEFMDRMDIAADASGNAVAAWSRYTDTDGSGTIDRIDDNVSVFSRRFDAATATWSALSMVNTTDVNGAYVSTVQADPTGGFLVLWYQLDAGYDERGWASFYRGGVLQPAESLWGHADSYWPRGAAFDAAGNVFAFASRDATIAAMRYAAGVGWGPPVILQGDPLSDANLEDFTVSANGSAFVLWRDEFAGQEDAFARRYNLWTGAWDPAVPLDVPDSGDIRNGARIVADAEGNAMATWHADDGIAQSYYAARYFLPSGWSAAVEIDAGALETVRYGTCLGVDGGGSFIAAWAQGADDDEDVYANRFE